MKKKMGGRRREWEEEEDKGDEPPFHLAAGFVTYHKHGKVVPSENK
jgi:hypothetical protein